MRRLSCWSSRCTRSWKNTLPLGWQMRTSSRTNFLKLSPRRSRNSYSKWCVRSQNHRRSTCKTSSHHCPKCAISTGGWMSKSVQDRKIEWSKRRYTSKWICRKTRRAGVTSKINRSCSRLAKDSWVKCWQVLKRSTPSWPKWRLLSNEHWSGDHLIWTLWLRVSTMALHLL